MSSPNRGRRRRARLVVREQRRLVALAHKMLSPRHTIITGIDLALGGDVTGDYYNVLTIEERRRIIYWPRPI